jgi:hypothetical protein
MPMKLHPLSAVVDALLATAEAAQKASEKVTDAGQAQRLKALVEASRAQAHSLTREVV